MDQQQAEWERVTMRVRRIATSRYMTGRMLERGVGRVNKSRNSKLEIRNKPEARNSKREGRVCRRGRKTVVYV
jgi:hypothetical protein